MGLLRMHAGYDAAQVRRRAAEIDVRRYRPGLDQPVTDAAVLPSRQKGS